MTYKEFLLRLAELVEESDDTGFYLCHFCGHVRRGADAAVLYTGEIIAASKMLLENPQCRVQITTHADTLKTRILELEECEGEFGVYVAGRWPGFTHNTRRVLWLREEAETL